MSCQKAQMYFEQHSIVPETVADARKEKIGTDAAWEIIRARDTVFIGKGKKVVSFGPSPENKAEILKSAMGRSGNLRAPALKTEKAVYIGYNETIYSDL